MFLSDAGYARVNENLREQMFGGSFVEAALIDKDGNIDYFEDLPCHGDVFEEVEQYAPFTDTKSYEVLTLLGGIDQGFLMGCDIIDRDPDEVAEVFFDWCANESPFKNWYITKTYKEALDRGVLNKITPELNASLGAIQLWRSLIDASYQWAKPIVFYFLKEKGFSSNVSYIVASYFAGGRTGIYFEKYAGEHDVIPRKTFSLEAAKNWCCGKFYYLNHYDRFRVYDLFNITKKHPQTFVIDLFPGCDGYQAGLKYAEECAICLKEALNE